MAIRTLFVASDGEEFQDLKTAEVYDALTSDITVPYMSSFNRRALAEWLASNYTLVPHIRNENELSFAASN